MYPQWSLQSITDTEKPHTKKTKKQSRQYPWRKCTIELVVSISKNPQNGKEQVENIEIQSDRCPYVLVVWEPLDQVISIVNYVPWENHGTDSTINRNRGGPQREEHLQNSITPTTSGTRSINLDVRAHVIGWGYWLHLFLRKIFPWQIFSWLYSVWLNKEGIKYFC